MRFGVHVSIGGGLEKAVLMAAEMGCETMQIFSSNPRGWRIAPLNPVAVADFNKLSAEKDIWPIILHTPYLVNLAAPDDEILRKSQESVAAALRRAKLLGGSYVVTHIGTYKETSLETGIARVIESLDIIFRSADSDVVLLLENTSGGARTIGACFSDFRSILRALPKYEDRLGVCLDTAHLWGAGYDISTADGVDRTLGEFAGQVGLSRLHVIHANDSATKLDSHRDIHEPPGEGLIGLECFAALVNHPGLQDMPFIIEMKTESAEAVSKELDQMRSLKSTQTTKLRGTIQVDRSYVATNNAERERLRAVIARLGDIDFGRPIGHGWTVSTTLAHLAFWDRRTVAALEEWERNGVHTSPIDPDPINDAMLPEWLAMSVQEVVIEVVAAAEAADHKAETVSEERAEEILAKRPRTMFRSIHRREHLDEIEHALQAK